MKENTMLDLIIRNVKIYDGKESAPYVADIGITCGVAIAFIGFMFFSPAAREHNDNNLQAGAEDGSDR